MSLFSLQVERRCLAGLLKFPLQVLPEIDSFISEGDFYNQINSTIFSVIRSFCLKGESVDAILVAERVKNLGISFKEDFDIYGYLESLAGSQINDSGAIKSFKELLSLRIRRDLALIGDNIKSTASSGESEDISEIIASCDAIYNKTVNLYQTDDIPQNLFNDIKEIIEAKGNNPVEESGFKTHFPKFNSLFSGIRKQNIYCFASRAGQGKSTFLNDLCFNTYLQSERKIKVLYLDTELNRLDNQLRMVAAITGVPFWYLDSGNFRRNEEMVSKVRAAWQEINKYEYYHMHVAGKTTEQICSIAKRWYYSNVKRGGDCIVCYDYLKTTSEKAIGKGLSEWQAMGFTIDNFKRLSEFLDCPFLTAIQLNRTGESFNKKSEEVTDDSSAIGITDRLSWLASYLGIIRKKTLDECAMDGKEFGTHKLVTLKTRFQGRDSYGATDMVKRTMPDGKVKFMNNFINYDFQNFKVIEKGDLHEVLKAHQHNYQFNSTPENVDLDKNENTAQT